MLFTGSKKNIDPSRIFELGPQFQNMLTIVYLILATVTESVQLSA